MNRETQNFWRNRQESYRVFYTRRSTPRIGGVDKNPKPARPFLNPHNLKANWIPVRQANTTPPDGSPACLWRARSGGTGVVHPVGTAIRVANFRSCHVRVLASAMIRACMWRTPLASVIGIELLPSKKWNTLLTQGSIPTLSSIFSDGVATHSECIPCGIYLRTIQSTRIIGYENWSLNPCPLVSSKLAESDIGVVWADMNKSGAKQPGSLAAHGWYWR